MMREGGKKKRGIEASDSSPKAQVSSGIKASDLKKIIKVCFHFARLLKNIVCSDGTFNHEELLAEFQADSAGTESSEIIPYIQCTGEIFHPSLKKRGGIGAYLNSLIARPYQGEK